MKRLQPAFHAAMWWKRLSRATLLWALLALTATAILASGSSQAVAQQDPPGQVEKKIASMTGGEWTDSGPVDHIASPFPKPPPPSTTVRVTVLDVSKDLRRAGQVAVLLTRFRKRELEAHIGMKLQLANLSGFSTPPERVNVLYYRPGFMRAAMLIAKAIPGEQNVAPMKPALTRKDGIDVEIVLGAEAS